MSPYGFTGPQWVNLLTVDPLDPNLVITVPADVLVPNDAKPPAGMALSTKWLVPIRFWRMDHGQMVNTLAAAVGDDQGPVSISDKTSYRKISWSLEAARLVV